MKEYFLTILRNTKTNLSEFRRAAHQLSDFLAIEAAQLIPLRTHTVETPLGSAPGASLSTRIVLVSILRAGLVMLPSFQKIFWNAPIGFFGIRREEKTASPQLYYQNIPKISQEDWVLLLDPMLATGGSSSLALHRLIQLGASQDHTLLVSVLAAQEGLDLIQERFPKINIVLGAIDPLLNKNKFITPGLGDFGDRYFDTIG